MWFSGPLSISHHEPKQLQTNPSCGQGGSGLRVCHHLFTTLFLVLSPCHCLQSCPAGPWFRLGSATTGGAHSFSRSQVNAALRTAPALLLLQPEVSSSTGLGWKLTIMGTCSTSCFRRNYLFLLHSWQRAVGLHIVVILWFQAPKRNLLPINTFFWISFNQSNFQRHLDRKWQWFSS